MALSLPVFVIAGEARDGGTVSSAAVERLVGALREAGLSTRRASTFEDGLQLVQVYADHGCVVLDWSLRTGEHAEVGECTCAAHALVRAIRARGSKRVPIFLITEKTPGNGIPDEVADEVQEYIHLYTDTPAFIAGRVKYALSRYADRLLPPYFKALQAFAADAPYYWDCPGHMGGVAYLKHPVGAEFHRFFGENIMRADVGVMAPPLGDWLNHQGPPGESEENAARIFGADRTYYVVGGSSLSNQIVAHGTVAQGELVFVDRNCHKSLNHALTVTSAKPVYLNPKRNGYALLGLIPREHFRREHLKRLVAAQYPDERPALHSAALAIVTNSTYDGLCYKVKPVTDLLAQTVRRIHYDEAWYAYAAFHDLYKGRYAMEEDDEPGASTADKPLLFAVHSTHKMLAAFSMASMIHVKNTGAVDDTGAKLFDHGRFNEAFMMHGTTSPFYPILASIDVATAMMEQPGGRTLMNEAIDDALDFRRSIASYSPPVGADPWFFKVFQPELPTEDVDARLRDPDFWTLKPDPEPTWHGFEAEDIADGHCLLDPTKVTVLCPGIDAHGRFEERGVPARVVARFLDSRRISIAKNGDYTILLLFSIGTSKGKWGTFREALVDFKRLHDSGASVSEALPALAEAHPAVYGSFERALPTREDLASMLNGGGPRAPWRYATLRDLCEAMHQGMRWLDIPKSLGDACDVKPDIVHVPGAAYQKLVQRETAMGAPTVGAVSAGMIVPYPPGIPILMPGERLQEEHVRLFRRLELFGRVFPGFEPGLHGIQRDAKGSFNLRLLTGQGAELLAEAAEGPEAQRLRARFRRSGRTGR